MCPGLTFAPSRRAARQSSGSSRKDREQVAGPKSSQRLKSFRQFSIVEKALAIQLAHEVGGFERAFPIIAASAGAWLEEREARVKAAQRRRVAEG